MYYSLLTFAVIPIVYASTEESYLHIVTVFYHMGVATCLLLHSLFVTYRVGSVSYLMSSYNSQLYY